MHLGATMAAILVFQSPSLGAPLRDAKRSMFEVEYGASVFNEKTGFVRAHALNLGWAHRLGRTYVGVQTGANIWRVPLFDTDEQEHVGVWSLGPTLMWRYAAQRARSQIGAGLSVVVEPSAVDAHAGAIGFYVDARPMGLRFPLRDGWAVGLDPLASALRVPDVGGVPLVEVQFMTFLRLESDR